MQNQAAGRESSITTEKLNSSQSRGTKNATDHILFSNSSTFVFSFAEAELWYGTRLKCIFAMEAHFEMKSLIIELNGIQFVQKRMKCKEKSGRAVFNF